MLYISSLKTNLLVGSDFLRFADDCNLEAESQPCFREDKGEGVCAVLIEAFFFFVTDFTPMELHVFDGFNDLLSTFLIAFSLHFKGLLELENASSPKLSQDSKVLEVSCFLHLALLDILDFETAKALSTSGKWSVLVPEGLEPAS